MKKERYSFCMLIIRMNDNHLFVIICLLLSALSLWVGGSRWIVGRAGSRAIILGISNRGLSPMQIGCFKKFPAEIPKITI